MSIENLKTFGEFFAADPSPITATDVTRSFESALLGHSSHSHPIFLPIYLGDNFGI